MKRITLVFWCILCVNLCACSTTIANSNALRNRNFDYERVNVENLNAPIKTPPGLTPPGFKPKFTIPPGQNKYQPDAIAPLTPPGFSQVYEIPPVKAQPTN